NRVPVAADVLDRHVARTALVLVADDPACVDRRRSLGIHGLAVDAPVVGKLLLHRLPRLLRDDQQPDAELGHDRGGLRRDRRRIGTAAEALERPRPDVAPDLLDQLPVVFAGPALQALQDHLRRLDEELAALLLILAEALELHPSQAAAEAQD